MGNVDKRGGGDGVPVGDGVEPLGTGLVALLGKPKRATNPVPNWPPFKSDFPKANLLH